MTTAPKGCFSARCTDEAAAPGGITTQQGRRPDEDTMQLSDKAFDLPGHYFIGSRRVPFLEYAEHAAKTSGLELPPMPKVSIGLVLITPESAKAILDEANIGNRDADPAQVAKIAKDMVNRRYFFTGQSIILSKDKLLDAQHRLLAVIESGMAQYFIVVVGVDNEAQKVIDATTKIRTLADVIKIFGKSMSTLMVNAIAFATADFDRKKVKGLTQPQRVELTLAVSEELVHGFQSVASAAHVGQVGSRAVLAACFEELQQLERRGLNSLVRELADWLIAALRNDPGKDDLATELFNKLRSRRKCPKSAIKAQANDQAIRRIISKMCALHLQAQDERLNGRVAVG